MKNRILSLLLALTLLLGVGVLPASAAEYALQEGDIVYIPGGVLAGGQYKAYAMKSATAATGEQVTLTVPEGTDKADGTTAAAGPKGNISADRFWGMLDGKLTRMVGVWEKTASPLAYKVSYHDTVTEVTDTTVKLANNGSHNGGGNCAHNFSTACGEKSETTRYAECAAEMKLAKDLVLLDLRRSVVSGSGKPVKTLTEVKELCSQGLAVVNCFAPDGTKAGGTVTAVIVLDFEAKAEPEDMNVPAGAEVSVGRGDTVVVNFNGGGTLKMHPYGALDIRGSVTGKTEVTVTGTCTERTFVTAPAATPDDAFCFKGEQGKMVVTNDGTTKSWSVTGLPDVGLKITAPEGATLLLHTGAASRAGTVNVSNLIPVSSQTATDGQVTYYFKRLSPGVYHYTLEREGYYTVFQNVDYTEEQSRTGRSITTVPIYKMRGNGFEPKFYIVPTQEFLDKAMQSKPDTWGEEYAQIFTTPYFTRDKSVSGMHQQTTQEEMMDFIRALDGEGDNMYVFPYGTSPKYGYEMPIVVFTKENVKGKTLEEVAEIFKTNAKPTLHFEGQIHSNEPAGGEVTLAFIKQMDGAYGDKILDTMDVYFIPRVNPDGAHDFIRQSVKTKEDMNRDFMSVKNEEVRLVIGAYNLFRPEVTVCTHEQHVVRNENERSARMDDVSVNMSSVARSLPEAAEVSLEIMEQARANVTAKGLRIGTYSDYFYSANTLVDNGYLGNRGSIGMLTETLGILGGAGWYERRVASSYTAIKTLIDYVAEHPDKIVDLVRRNRADLVTRGATYDEGDLFIANFAASRSGPVWPGSMMDQHTGEVSDPDYTFTMLMPSASDIKLARPRPTAYVVPQNIPGAADLTALADKHDVKWYELPAGSAVKLRQYVMPEKSASLTEEQTVTFRGGAYVFPMNQDTANILGMLMEPDSVGYQSTGVKCNVVDMKLVARDASGYLPLYRYCHDLADGKIAVETPCKGDASCPAAGFGDVDKNAWYHAAVDSMIANGIMSGYGEGKFGPNDTLNRAMVVQVLYNRMGKPEVKGENKFTDVAAGAWYHDAVRWAAEKEIVSGYGDGRFGPEDEITIEQAAVILHNYSGKPVGESDLAAVGTYSDWAAGALSWCEANGLLKDIPFEKAIETATRAQTAQLLFNYLNP